MSRNLQIYLDNSLLSSVTIDSGSSPEITLNYLRKLRDELYDECYKHAQIRPSNSQIYKTSFLDILETVITFIETKEDLG